MNWTVLICFGAGVGVYLICVGVFTLIKRAKYKKQYKKELEENEKAEKDNSCNS